MSRAASTLSRLVITLCISCSATSWASAQSTTKLSPNDEKAIRQLVTTFESGWNNHDMTAIGSIFRDDAEFINVVGMHWHGKAAIVKAHAAFHEVMFKDCKLHTDHVAIRQLSPNSGIAVWVSTQDDYTTPSGTLVPKHQTRLTLVVSKDAKAGWQVVHGQNTSIDSQAARFDPVNKE